MHINDRYNWPYRSGTTPGTVTTFGATPAATTVEQTAVADRAVAAVRRAYSDGASKIGLTPDAIARFFLVWTLDLIPSVSEYFTSNQELAVRKNYSQLGVLIKRWETTYRAWAVQRRRDDGTPYGWRQWSDFALTLLGSIRDQTGYGADASTLSAVKDAVLATAHQIAHPSEWPGWLKAALGLGIAAAGLYVVRSIAPRRRAT